MNVLWASQLTVEWLWTTTWQASLLALFVLGIQRLFADRLAPEWRYFLWWFVALRLVLPAPIPAAWSAFNLLPTPSLKSPSAEARLSAVREQSAPAQLPSLPPPSFTLEPQFHSVAPPARRWGVLEFVAVLWLGGAFIAGVRLWRAHRRLAGIVRRGSRNTCPRVVEVLRECVSLMRLHRAPPVVVVSGFEGPALVGCLRPALVLPAELPAVLSNAELRHVFLHELAHLRRRDHVLNYVVCLLEVVHWVNPLLRQKFHRLRADRELACDALALSRLPAAQRCSYGATLLKLLQTASPNTNLPHLVGILEDKQLIQRRIRMIARPSTHSNRTLAWLTTGVLGFLTLTGAQTSLQGGPDGSSPITALANPAAEQGSGSSTSIEQERAIDKRNLQTIYQAITAYYRDNKDLPNWLSDLVPKYLPDAEVLVSPVEKRTGNAVLFGREDPKIHTSYIYEFNAAPAPEEFNIGRDVPLTCKQWKLMQMGKFGMVTPILRAHGSQTVLNVAYSGDIYETGLLWENDPNTRRLVRNKPELGPQSSQNAQGPSVSILVVDTNDKPISGALIRHGLGTEFGLLPPGELKSDANGKAVLSLGEWKSNFLFLTASHPSFFAKGMEWNGKTSGEQAPPSELKLQLATKQ